MVVKSPLRKSKMLKPDKVSISITGGTVSIFPVESVPVVSLPAISTVTASTVMLPSANADRSTSSMLQAPATTTVCNVIDWLLLSETVTVIGCPFSTFWTTPCRRTDWTSSVLSMLSASSNFAVILARVSLTIISLEVTVLPATSVTLASTVKIPSANPE